MNASYPIAPSTHWTFEQLLGLSPDHFTIRSGYGNATPQKWRFLGAEQEVVWGLFDNKKRPPFQVALLLDEMYFSCTCLSRRFPCQHIIGLLLMYSQSADRFKKDSFPPWLRERQHQAASVWNQPNPAKLVDVDTLGELRNGLSELEKWLHDLIQNGLATLPDKKKAYFETIATRMWDIQALTLTSKLLELANIDKTQPDWPKQYLRQLGPLALLIQGFKKFESQPPPVQADLLAATGRPLPLYSSHAATHHDQWLVLGQLSETSASHQKLVTWVWGIENSKVARLEQSINGKHPAGVCYITGSLLRGAVQFGESAWPLRAQFVEKPLLQVDPLPPIGEASFRNAVGQYATAKRHNPWIEQFPLVLSACLPIQENGRWLILDQQQNILPLVPSFNYGWHLAALSGGQPIGIFGMWNGRILDPLSVLVDAQWIDLHTYWGVK